MKFNDVFSDLASKAAIITLNEFPNSDKALLTNNKQIGLAWIKEDKRSVGFDRKLYKQIEGAKATQKQ